jgi:hypothetical protein
MMFDLIVRRASWRVVANPRLTLSRAWRIPAFLMSLLLLAAPQANAQTAPVAVDDGPFVVDEGGSLEGAPRTRNVLSNDRDDDGDPLTSLSVVPGLGPANALSFNLNIDSGSNNFGTIDYTHNGSETTSDSFVYEVCDDEVSPRCDQA